MRTNDELKQLAKDVFDGKVFTSAHFKTTGDMQEYASIVFSPLLYINDEQFNKLLEDMGDNYFLYEYYEKAVDQTTNGYPVFNSFNHLKKEDYPVFLGFHAIIEKEAGMKNEI